MDPESSKQLQVTRKLPQALSSEIFLWLSDFRELTRWIMFLEIVIKIAKLGLADFNTISPSIPNIQQYRSFVEWRLEENSVVCQSRRNLNKFSCSLLLM